MAEAGPSTASGATAGSSSNAKHSRIHFPQEREYGSFSSIRSDGSSAMASLGLGKPPLSRRVTHDAANGRASRSADVRPRVQSVDAWLPTVTASSGPSRARRTSEQGTDSSRKVTPASKRSRKEKGRADLPDLASIVASGASFSDEYDLGISISPYSGLNIRLMSCSSRRQVILEMSPSIDSQTA
ncbi:hypothetical protein K474DRAFT_824631 [Panus rudis PR-1116 ss-1]|nr:hypothetical protein K474DRAFT_824631 [Panus rudis PR-1116 ss-1]